MTLDLCSFGFLSFELGKQLPVSTLAEGDIQTLRAQGFEFYSSSDLPPPALAFAAAGNALDKSSLGASEIDAVVYATNSFWRPEFASLTHLHGYLLKLGLTHVRLDGLFLGNCSNSTNALRYAAGLIAEGARQVLVVVTDSVDPNGGSRLVRGNYAVLGDAGCAFLVGPPGAFEWRLLGLGQAVDNTISTMSPGSGAYIVGAARGMRRAVDTACEQADVTASRLQALVMSNLQTRICRATARGLGLPVDAWHGRTLAQLGHCFAADVFLNLDDLAGTGSVDAAPILLYSQSIGAWGAAVVARARVVNS